MALGCVRPSTKPYWGPFVPVEGKGLGVQDWRALALVFVASVKPQAWDDIRGSKGRL